jgi:hypothetical protein
MSFTAANRRIQRNSDLSDLDVELPHRANDLRHSGGAKFLFQQVYFLFSPP